MCWLTFDAFHRLTYPATGLSPQRCAQNAKKWKRRNCQVARGVAECFWCSRFGGGGRYLIRLWVTCFRRYSASTLCSWLSCHRAVYYESAFGKGWYVEAESYLVTTSRLLAGLRLDKIVLRDRTAPGESQLPCVCMCKLLKRRNRRLHSSTVLSEGAIIDTWVVLCGALWEKGIPIGRMGREGGGVDGYRPQLEVIVSSPCFLFIIRNYSQPHIHFQVR